MQKNRISKLLLFAICFIFFLACENKIDTNEPSTNGYVDAISAHTAVNNLYSKGLPALYFSADSQRGIPLAWGAYASGLIESESQEGYYQALINQAHSSPFINELANLIYADCFNGIEAADSIIIQIPNTGGLKPAEQAKLIGEAKFFRAFNRFYLIRTFGSYPNERTNSPYLSLESAYINVERDLQEAIATLPDKEFIENNSHATKFVARALLGDVYLHMSGYPLLKNKYIETTEILRPIIMANKHHLVGNGMRDEMSAFNVLRTTPTNDEYLFLMYGGNGTQRSSFAFPKAAKGWDNVKENVAFNAFKPTELFMLCYGKDDIRGKDRQFFHTFFKVKDKDKTVFEIFDPAPFFWLPTGVDIAAPQKQTIGLYRYAEILLMTAEAIVQTEGVTPEAANYLAQVRARAIATSQAELEQFFATLTVESFLKEIWMERLRELPFEMKQLSDITRTNFYPVNKENTLEFISIKEAQTPQGIRLDEKNFFLPRPN